MSPSVSSIADIPDNFSRPAGEISYTPVNLIRVSDIDASSRMRPVDPLVVQAIAASIQRDGLLSPIDICQLPGRKDYRLVFGGHRLEAIKLLSWEHIPAFIRSANALDRRSREIAENIFKADLSPLDRAAFVAELHAVEKARAGLSVDDDGRKAGANVRWQKELKNQAADANATIAFAYGFTEAVAEKLGLKARAIQYDLLLFKRLAPSLVARVRALPIGSNASALRKLAGLEPEAQIKAVTLIEQGKAKGVNDALAVIEKRPPVDAGKKRLSTFLDTFARMGRKEQREALEFLRARAPAGLQFKFPDELKSPSSAANDRPDDVVDIEEAIANQARGSR